MPTDSIKSEQRESNPRSARWRRAALPLSHTRTAPSPARRERAGVRAVVGKAGLEPATSAFRLPCAPNYTTSRSSRKDHTRDLLRDRLEPTLWRGVTGETRTRSSSIHSAGPRPLRHRSPCIHKQNGTQVVHAHAPPKSATKTRRSQLTFAPTEMRFDHNLNRFLPADAART